MDQNELEQYRKMVREYQQRDDPTGWFKIFIVAMRITPITPITQTIEGVPSSC